MNLDLENAKRLRQIEKVGTRIVSFTYDGKGRNVLVGRKDVQVTPRGATALSRDIHARNGKMFLRGVCHNEGFANSHGNIKSFNLAKIEGLKGI